VKKRPDIEIKERSSSAPRPAKIIMFDQYFGFFSSPILGNHQSSVTEYIHMMETSLWIQQAHSVV
jgi:hypothetical protein